MEMRYEQPDAVIKDYLITAVDGKSYKAKHEGEATVWNFRTVQTETPSIIAHKQARLHAETGFEKYRVVQDRPYESDSDLMLKQLAPDSGRVSNE